MANQTAAREFAMHNSTRSLALPALASTSYYRGAAVGLMINSGTAAQIGRLSNTFTGAALVNFMGVIPRNQGGSSGSADAKIAVKRDGAVVFDAVTTAGNGATPGTGTSSWMGKPVWFVSDHEVSLTPPSQLYPIYAGRVIATAAEIAWDRLGSQEVLVEIEDAVQHPATNWATINFIVDGNLIAQTQDAVVGLVTFARRVFLGRTFVQTVIPLDAGTVKIETWNGTSELGTTGGVAPPANQTTTMAINNTYGVFDYDDALTIKATEAGAGNPTAGLLNVICEYLPIQ